ncbi:Transcriptional regulator, TetR family [[Actinomadura] parvosata subsp. kistnae]|uniref:TetR family transcriptional regulator n=1 Tax=[Actinomadura] parvosata subsp. kistnae TaxID=1909395 RepID=A0A1V0ADY8_9ACTN|nr:TetR family transcriptional regulator [Nonomuraea sp. ATCC 55076]AQZ68440.1 TetR family transcriptional regulator [Nonomuraea sp. ATCC 55076]SPL93114.1 Transcriptional regulator, TetR family [Actinomadura parvosata subsp. kistnae]
MTRSAFLRARRPEHKQQRREAILAAARELARTSGVRNVSLGAVAEAVGLAKSNIVRYFGTREEIYLELLVDEWHQWGEAVAERLRTVGSTAEAMTVLAETIADRPLFCDLLGHASTSLEHNVSVPAARTFKHAVLDQVGAMGAELARATDLTEREGAELVGAASGLAGMLYPASNPPPALAQVYAEDPELAATCPVLLPTLLRALSALAAGLPTLRER